MRSLSTSTASTLLPAEKAPVAEVAHGCGAHFQRLASHRFHLQGTRMSGLCWHAFGMDNRSRTRARPRRCKMRARPVIGISSSLLLVALLSPSTSQPLGPRTLKAPCGGLVAAQLETQRVFRFFCHGTEALGKETSVERDPVRCHERLGFAEVACVSSRASDRLLSRGVYETFSVCVVMFSAAPVTAVEFARYQSDADFDVACQTHPRNRSRAKQSTVDRLVAVSWRFVLQSN